MSSVVKFLLERCWNPKGNAVLRSSWAVPSHVLSQGKGRCCGCRCKPSAQSSARDAAKCHHWALTVAFTTELVACTLWLAQSLRLLVPCMQTESLKSCLVIYSPVILSEGGGGGEGKKHLDSRFQSSRLILLHILSFPTLKPPGYLSPGENKQLNFKPDLMTNVTLWRTYQ